MKTLIVLFALSGCGLGDAIRRNDENNLRASEKRYKQCKDLCGDAGVKEVGGFSCECHPKSRE